MVFNYNAFQLILALDAPTELNPDMADACFVLRMVAEQFSVNQFPLLDEHDYAEAVIDSIRMISSQIPVMRLQTDTLSEALIAPRWIMKKGQFIDYVTLQMNKRGIRQGDAR